MPLPDRPEGCSGVQLFRTGDTLEDMVASLDDDKVLFGVVKTSLDHESNASTFSRKAVVHVVYKGSNIGQVKAAKIMARKLSVGNFCGECTKIVSQVTCEDREQVQEVIHSAIKACTIDDSHDIGNVEYHLGFKRNQTTEAGISCTRFQVDLANEGGFGVCVCGHKKHEHSKEALMNEVPAHRDSESSNAPAEAEPPAAQPPAPEPAPAPETGSLGAASQVERLKRQATMADSRTAYATACADGHEPSAEEVLEIVRNEYGTPYNWALFKPNRDRLIVEDAGSGSVMELSGVLERSMDKLLYGICRVAFGVGKLRRTFLFTVHWQGTQCSGVKALQLRHECGAKMEALMGESSFTIHANGPDDVMPQEIILKLRTTCVVDSGEDNLSVQALVEALQDEQTAIRDHAAERERRKREKDASEAAAAEVERTASKAEAQAADANASRTWRSRSSFEASESEVPELRSRSSAPSSFGEASSVAEGIKQVGERVEDSWILFEIKI